VGRRDSVSSSVHLKPCSNDHPHDRVTLCQLQMSPPCRPLPTTITPIVKYPLQRQCTRRWTFFRSSLSTFQRWVLLVITRDRAIVFKINMLVQAWWSLKQAPFIFTYTHFYRVWSCFLENIVASFVISLCAPCVFHHKKMHAPLLFHQDNEPQQGNKPHTPQNHDDSHATLSYPSLNTTSPKPPPSWLMPWQTGDRTHGRKMAGEDVWIGTKDALNDACLKRQSHFWPWTAVCQFSKRRSITYDWKYPSL